MKTNINFDLGKLLNKIKEYKIYFYITLAVMFLGLVIYSVYMVYSTKNEVDDVVTKNSKINEIKINFDREYLRKLEEKQSPSIINGVGGKNPFQGF